MVNKHAGTPSGPAALIVCFHVPQARMHERHNVRLIDDVNKSLRASVVVGQATFGCGSGAVGTLRGSRSVVYMSLAASVLAAFIFASNAARMTA